jgi:hypothetical protein
VGHLLWDFYKILQLPDIQKRVRESQLINSVILARNTPEPCTWLINNPYDAYKKFQKKPKGMQRFTPRTRKHGLTSAVFSSVEIVLM